MLSNETYSKLYDNDNYLILSEEIKKHVSETAVFLDVMIDIQDQAIALCSPQGDHSYSRETVESIYGSSQAILITYNDFMRPFFDFGLYGILPE